MTDNHSLLSEVSFRKTCIKQRRIRSSVRTYVTTQMQIFIAKGCLGAPGIIYSQPFAELSRKSNEVDHARKKGRYFGCNTQWSEKS